MDIVANIRNREERRIRGCESSCMFQDDMGAPTEGEEAPFRESDFDQKTPQEAVHFVSMND